MKKKLLFLLTCMLLILTALLTACSKSEIPQVTLTMVSSNGLSDTVVKVESGKSYALPSSPSYEGHEFGGWYTSADFKGEPITEVAPTKDTSVYAKWTKLYTLSLDPAGGTLSTTTLRLKAGESIAEKIAGLTPQKADCQFGMWTLYGEPLAENAIMAAEDTTLVAQYKIKYTVDVYLQNTDRTGYQKQESPTVGYAYVGETFTSTPSIKGFTEITKPETVNRLVLSDDTSKNVFCHYFDRAVYSLTFVSNYPDGSENERVSHTIYHGVPSELPLCSFELDGYFLEGWALSANGKMEYSSHLMDGALFNDTSEKKSDVITPESNVTLYAVWSKGYSDLFGGSDILYVSAGEKNTVFLCRGDIFFKGTLTGKNILFMDASVDFPMGVLNSDGKTFLFLNNARAELSATLYEAGKGVNELVKLYLDSANGVTYSTKESADAATTVDSVGEFFFTDDGNMVAKFKDGPLKDKTITFKMGQMSDENNAPIAVFQVRNEEEIALGTLLAFVVKNNALVPATNDNGEDINYITLDGFGNAALYANGKSTAYYYAYDAEKNMLTLRSTSGQSTYVLKLMTINGELGYMIYNSATDVTYTLADGSTLSIDGMRTATYTPKGGTAVSGFYSAKSSAFKNCTILSFVDTNTDKEYIFTLTTTQVEVPADPSIPDSKPTKTTVTTVELKPEGYSEYYYRTADGGVYRAPLLVFDSKDRTSATVYGYATDALYYKLATASLVYDQTTGTYTLTVTERFEVPDGVELLTTTLDFATVKSCVLALDSTTTQYNIHFWFNYENDVETIDLSKVYQGANDSKLTLVAGLAIYQNNQKVSLGTFKQTDALITVTFSDSTLYFKLNEEEMTFEVYSSITTTYYEVDKESKVSKNRYLTIDPINKSIIFTIITGEGDDAVTTKYPGTITNTNNKSLTGFTIMEFTSTEKNSDGTPKLRFKFIDRSISANHYIFVYDAAYAGKFVSANTKNGVLDLDGFGFAATYSDASGLSVMGTYVKNGNEVSISTGGTTYHFVLQEGNACMLRNSEYGKAFLLMDNRVFKGLYVEMDGIGGAKVFTLVSSDSGTEYNYIDEKATYAIGEDGVIEFKYTEGNTEHTLLCKFGTYTTGGRVFNALNILHDEVVQTYVNTKDWTVLRLNNDGSATKHLIDGQVETGTYSLVTETLLYYVNSDATDAYIYVYDKEAGTATPRAYTEIGYYTKDLDSLLFSKYGFAIFNNETRYYYTVNDDDTVTLYHFDENATDRNAYGYVEETFGTFDDIKTYNGKQYFKNDGFAISFKRGEADKDKYPVLVANDLRLPSAQLTFAPTGAQTFSVNGQVYIGDTAYSCVVVKELDESGNPVMYFRIGTYYFYITVNYQGDGIGDEVKSTYEVTGLSYIQNMPAYSYLYLVYGYASMGYQPPANDFGTVSLCRDYNELGEMVDFYLNASFGKNYNFVLTDGTLLTAIEKAPANILGYSTTGIPYYQANFVASDGYKYSIIIACTPVSIFNTTGYNIYALLREETLTTDDGYKLTLTRIIASESTNISAGSYYSFELMHNEEKLDASLVFLSKDNLYYAVRTKDENGKIIATDYYQLNLTSKSNEALESGDGSTTTNTSLPVYESLSVSKISVTTVYTADNKYYVDILPGNQILIMVECVEANGKTTENVVFIIECTYEGGVYTVKDVNGNSYTISVTDNVATVTKLAPADPATEN